MTTTQTHRRAPRTPATRATRVLMIAAIAAVLGLPTAAATTSVNSPDTTPAFTTITAAPSTTAPVTTAPFTTGPTLSSSSAWAGGDASGALYRADRTSSVGQMLTSTTMCTATVVTSDTRDVAVTAAHCVYWPAAGPWASTFPSHGWASLEEFVPGRSGDAAPYGRWQIAHAWIDPRWRDTGDAAYDVAFLEIAPLQGQHVQDVVGSQGIAFDPVSAGATVTALGYPGEAPFDGRTLRRCWTSSLGVDRSTADSVTMPCTMTPGASGGPWLTGFDPATGAGTVVAVTSFHDDADQQLWARPLGAVGYALYQTADHVGRQ